MGDWADVPAYLRAPGMSNKWIGNDTSPEVWHISGFNEGAEGAFISGPIKGLVHRPFKSIWHSPAYGAPRFERTVDERKEISTRIALCSDSEYGWQDVETKWWNGMDGGDPGFWATFTRRTGELWIPMQLADAVATELTEDPGYENYVQEWDILLAADGEPRWRMPDLQPPDWVNDWSATTSVKRDDGLLAPEITVGVGKFKVANRGTAASWPVVMAANWAVVNAANWVEVRLARSSVARLAICSVERSRSWAVVSACHWSLPSAPSCRVLSASMLAAAMAATPAVLRLARSAVSKARSCA
ncbi:MAG TPA: hypothetical protein P5061_10730, partial [Mycobacterium sp.]|nr:hypothetical protein [Mycobacterium sp.]